jgi:hypothetical protein
MDPAAPFGHDVREDRGERPTLDKPLRFPQRRIPPIDEANVRGPEEDRGPGTHRAAGIGATLGDKVTAEPREGGKGAVRA